MEKSHEWLIDSLYEEREDQPDNPEPLSPELEEHAKHELASYDAMLSELREGLIMHSPRSEVSEAIRAEARQQAQKFAASQAAATSKPGRRVPGSQPSTHDTLWSKAKRQGVLQLVAVLAVCLGAGLLLRTISFGDRSESPAMEATAGMEEPEAWSPSPAAAAQQNTGLAQNAEEQLRGDDFPELDYKAQVDEEESSLKVALKDENTRKELPGELAKSTKEVSPQKSSRRAKKARRPSSRSNRGEANKKDRSPAIKKTSTSKAAPSKAAPSKAEPSKVTSSMDSLFGGQEDIAQERKMADAPVVSGKRDAIGNVMTDDDLFASNDRDAEPTEVQDKSSSGGSVVTQNEPQPVASAPAVAAASEDEVAPPTATLAEAERSLRKNDYEQTLQDADAYLARGVGSNRERARAMEIKAKALENLGRANEAQGIYEQIRETYPDYYRKEKIETKKKRSKAKPRKKSNYDSSSGSTSY